MKPTEEQLARLPKWAQNEIWRLSRNLAALEEELAALHVEPADDRPQNDDWGAGRGKGLPCRRVRFAKWGVTLTASDEGVYISGDDTLAITPRASNVAIVTSKRMGRD